MQQVYITMNKNNHENGIIVKVSGSLVVAQGLKEAKMYDVVKVGTKKLIGEIIEIKGDKASIQVYENTSGVGPGEPVFSTNKPIAVELGPGLIESIYDGIQRPLNLLYEISGHFIARGVEVPGIDREKNWGFKPKAKVGDIVSGGDILGEVEETILVPHKVMVPPYINGEIIEIKEGSFTVEETIVKIKTKKGEENISMLQVWPIREARPVREKIKPDELLITGQRVIDAFFPVVKGGVACVPGPFGSGKTITQHQLAKWANADIIVFIGCGERGNEMTDVLQEFPELKDPKSGEPLMKRTILVANTSNMPVAAREASVYTGITIAEYYRDMGYNVALMADSTSRWAEAMREISGRLEEMPGEEGYPAYLGSRIAAFYERAGKVRCLGKEDKQGSLTIIGAVSPPGGDLSEPVTQNTLRVVKVFWGLDSKLAYARHYPAINWLSSYSLYLEDMEGFMKKEIGGEWPEIRAFAMQLLQKDDELKSIVQLVGVDSLSHQEQLILITAQSIKEDFLQQNAYDDVDTYSSLSKMFWMLKIILGLHQASISLMKSGKSIKEIADISIRKQVAQLKYIPESEAGKFEQVLNEINFLTN